MASNYPSSLPVKDAAGATLATNPHSTLHDAMYDDIVAIATELGTLPKGTAASVKARLDALPRGVMDYATVTTSQTGITTETTLTGLSVTFTGVAGRLYRVSMWVRIGSTVVDDVASLKLDNGGTQLATGANVYATTGAAVPIYVSTLQEFTGSTTLTATLTRTSGTGDLSTSAFATNPGFLMVEDVGVA